MSADTAAANSPPGIRREPGGDAYYASLIRHGGTEFGGVDKPRVPAPPGAYERALAWAASKDARQ